MKNWKFLLIIILALGLFKFITAEHILYSTTSFDGKYEVQISQKRGYELIERYVYLRVDRRNTPFIEKELLFNGDWLDADFKDYYPNLLWLAPNILAIGKHNENAQDRLRIVNTGDQTLKYLLIETYRDKFIIFDFEPNSVVDLNFYFYGILSVQAKIDETSGNFGNAVKLKDNEKSVRNKEFVISISGQDINIEAPGVSLEKTYCCGIKR